MTVGRIVFGARASLMLGFAIAAAMAASGCNAMQGLDELSYRSDELPPEVGTTPPEECSALCEEGTTCDLETDTCVSVCGTCEEGTTCDLATETCTVCGTCEEGTTCDLATETCTACGTCEEGTTCDLATETCTVCGTCEESTYCNIDSAQCEELTTGPVDVDPVLANVLFMVDRSCSAKAKFPTITGALESAWTEQNGSANWGLMLFPDETLDDDDTYCTQDTALHVDIANATEEAMEYALASSEPKQSEQCATNISGSFAVVDQLVATPPDSVVLITDGVQIAGCGGGGTVDVGVDEEDDITVGIIEKLGLEGVATYVVGFEGKKPNNNSSQDEDALNAFAQAGGNAQWVSATTSPPNSFYAMEQISKVVAAAATTCKFTLAKTPAPVQEIRLSIGGEFKGSYDADSNTITLGADTCEEIREDALGEDVLGAVNVEFVSSPLPAQYTAE